MSDSEFEGEEITDLSNPAVTTKYTTAGDIAKEAIKYVLSLATVGADVAKICSLGDDFIKDKSSKVYTKGVRDPETDEIQKVPRGIAFPTCISINQVIGFFSPSESDLPAVTIRKGDVLKVDLGVHIDGYCAVVATTVVAGLSDGEIVSGRKADVILATHYAKEAFMRLCRPGESSRKVTDLIHRIAENFNCRAVPQVYSHQMKQHVIDSQTAVANSKCADDRVDDFEFNLYETYGIDVILTSNFKDVDELKPKDVSGYSCFIYKRELHNQHDLKTQKARQFLTAVHKQSPTMPFAVRNFEHLGEQVTKMGIVECRRHDLVSEYPSLTDEAGEFVAQFKCTCLLLPSGTKISADAPFNKDIYKSEFELHDEEAKKLVCSSLKYKKKV